MPFRHLSGEIRLLRHVVCMIIPHERNTMLEDVLHKEARLGWQTDPGLDRSELQFRRLLEKLPAGAYTCDPEGLITYFNQHAVQLWGRTPKLNDPADRFCGSFKLFSTDGSPIAHDK